jgi:hypothetical protein
MTERTLSDKFLLSKLEPMVVLWDRGWYSYVVLPKPGECYDVIWLQPWCDDCAKNSYGPDGGRTWCQDNVYGTCEECGREPVKYVLAEQVKP